MKIKFPFFLCILLACNGGIENKEVSAPPYDSIQESSVNLGEEREEFIKSYSNPFIIDTTFQWKDTVYSLSLRHFSSMDSGLTIPAKYNFDTNTTFTTHNFKSQLVLVKQGDTVVNMEISKEMFRKRLTPELQSYATLLFPTLRLNNDTIEIGYSLVIPVTDVGIPVAIQFNTNGSYKIAE